MDSLWEEFWWNSITGPNVVVNNVANALLANKMVVLKVPSDLPWRHSMRSAIHTAFKGKSDYHDIVIESIDVCDDNPNALEPGKFILKRYASSAIQKGYREKSRYTIQEYISVKNVIKNRIIWIKGLSAEDSKKWVCFCQGFADRTAEEGLFVLEIHDDVVVSESTNMRVIGFSECVNDYDCQLFNSFLLDGLNSYNNNWNRYISTCAAKVCSIDAEISEMLIRLTDFKNDSPLEGIKRIVELPDFTRRGKGSNSNHVLWNYRNGNFDEIEHRIWAAQVNVLFPIIELERFALVQRYREIINQVISDEQVYQYGEILHDAVDVELGTLCHLMSKRNDDGLYTLYIPKEEDRERIRFLHDCRNELAHVSCCTPEQICKLLD